MSSAVAAVALLVFGLVVTYVVRQARRGLLGSRALVGLAGLSAVGLAAMTVTDWPVESLRQFWADHSVLTATLSTLLLLGAGFLAFEARDNLEQATLNESLTTGAFGGLVDHMLDVDLALCLLARPEPPDGFVADGRPLRWLRERRDALLVPEDDPRCHPAVESGPMLHTDWRESVVDQSLRRLMAAVRDWAPLLTQTRDGTAVLVRIARLRPELLRLQRHLHDDDATKAWRTASRVRAECEVLALGLELGSGLGLKELRTGVLVKPAPGVSGVATAKQMNALEEAGAAIGLQDDRAAAAARRRIRLVLGDVPDDVSKRH